MFAMHSEEDVIDLLQQQPPTNESKKGSMVILFCIASMVYCTLNAIFFIYVLCGKCKSLNKTGKYGKMLKDYETDLSDATESEFEECDDDSLGILSISPDNLYIVDQ